ncbi:MAG: HIT family protein [Verrucomicrobia bacterium]|nr:HIT family protein [Verrucomicrobiota bacterium]
MASIFTRIINGEIPCHKIAEDDHFLAFLDIRPINKGHALVVPKKEVDYFFDLDEDVLSKVMLFAQPVAKAIEKVVPCARVGIIVAGLEVPHAHVHLIPFTNMGELSFARAREAKQKELAELAEKVKAALAS